MKGSAILRIIEGTQRNDPDMVLRYASQILPVDEMTVMRELILERFDPDAIKHVAVMESIDPSS